MTRTKGGRSCANAAMILSGLGMIAFASTCFKEVPLIGTVFLLPGDSILNAKMADPVLHYALFLAGGAFTAFGLFLQLRIGFSDALKDLKEDRRPSAEESLARSTVVSLSQIKEAKGLLDSGAISEDEFNRIKARIIRQSVS